MLLYLLLQISQCAGLVVTGHQSRERLDRAGMLGWTGEGKTVRFGRQEIVLDYIRRIQMLDSCTGPYQ